MSHAQNEQTIALDRHYCGDRCLDPGGGLALLDLPTLLLSRHGPPVPGPARGEGEEISSTDPPTPQRQLQKAAMGGGVTDEVNAWLAEDLVMHSPTSSA